MSGIELIVAALAAGASAGVTNTATAAVQDAYAGLKKALRGWFGDSEDVWQVLQADETQPDVWRAGLGDQLLASGASENAEILGAARRLLAAADPPAAKAFNITVETNNGAVGEFQAPVTFHQGPSVPPAPPAAG
ncbi:hypothetical protein [Micromonospora sp. WMMD1082]|uniref:hypothetical protein n=1 Tax=Micromonospora sp. WMMD1082 TaxID=3016104 RepID=UPI002415FAF1|nr:hypothetical protein [Micromonospora sp. WMMD1082]MDG4793500.1 hypothetical protein [Micromonospora sp. WMMD1082]